MSIEWGKITSEETVIAVHACGFENKDEICQVAKIRLQEATVCVWKNKIPNLIISGGVPYEKDGKLLAHLMKEYFGKNTNMKSVHCATDCFDSSTDIQNIIKIAQERNFSKILAISSYWHLWALKPLYKYWVEQMNYQGEIGTLEVDHRLDRYITGKKTRVFYFFYAGVIHLAIQVHFFKPLNKLLYSIFIKRKNGYPVSGCS